jgi:hypothetical protein
MSISGSMLTGAADGPDFAPVRAVFWWNLKTHRHGRLHVPAGYEYLASSPHGAVLAKGQTLYSVTTGGKLSRLGSPFNGSEIARAVADSHGIVITGVANHSTPTKLTYLSFGHPRRFTALRSGTKLGLVCPSLDGVAVACAAEANNGDVRADELIPLNGHRPTTITNTRLGVEFAMNGRRAIWNTGLTLESARLGSHKVTVGNATIAPSRYFLSVSGTDPYDEIRSFGANMISAFGGAVEVQHHSKRIALARTVHHATRLFTAPPSPAAVSQFSLNDGRAGFATDRLIARRPKARFSTFSTNVTTSHGRSAFSKAHLLHAGSDYVLAGVSKSTTVYSVRSGQEHADLVVTYHGHSHTISHVPFDSYLQVSGHRVMFAPDRLSSGGPTVVYDAATHTTTTVDTDAACCSATDQGTFYGRTPAMNSTSLFYMKADGSVWQHDLATGTETQLSDPVAKTIGGIVFATGQHVAWNVVHHGQPGHSSAYVDLATPGQPVAVDQRIVGLSEAGVLTTASNLKEPDGQVGFLGSYSVQSFSGKVIKVLSKRTVVVLPQIDGHTLAWVGAAGRLQIKHF